MSAATFINEMILALGVTVAAVVVGMLINHWRIRRRYYPRELQWPKASRRVGRDRRGAGRS